MKFLNLAMAVAIAAPLYAGACETKKACKTECPKANTEEEAHACVAKVVEAKKDDKKFLKSTCYAAFQHHEQHEKDEAHNH